jgi:hypothetical protein
MLGLPADPFEFLAERLREENIHIKLALQEMRMASTRIQVLSQTAAKSMLPLLCVGCVNVNVSEALLT